MGAGNFSHVAAELQKFSKDIKWNLMVIPFSEELGEEALGKFAAQLSKWKKEGHSLYLHGYMHKADLSLKRSLLGKLALQFTNAEAEFAGLSKEDSKMLLQKAMQAWLKLNVGEAKGFAAPAWYGRLFDLCKSLGFENYSSRFIIWSKKGSRLSIPFSTAGLPRIIIPFVNLCEKIYLRLYGIFNFLPVPRVVKHP